MKKFLSGFAVGIGVSVAAAWGYRYLLRRALWAFDNWLLDEEKPLTPYVYRGKVVGIQFENVVFALHDAPSQMNFDEACDYCQKQKIGDKNCCLPTVEMAESIPAVFVDLNKMLVKFGGEPLKAIENNGYWAANNPEQTKSLPWIVAFHKNASDYYDRSELAYVRSVIVLEEEF